MILGIHQKRVGHVHFIIIPYTTVDNFVFV